MNLENKRQFQKQYHQKYKLTHANRFSRLKSKAKLRNLPLELTFEQFVEVINQPCVYGAGTSPDILMGIDRKDNSLGYTVANSLPCCSKHNIIKNQFFSYEDMLFATKHCVSISTCGNEHPG